MKTIKELISTALNEDCGGWVRSTAIGGCGFNVEYSDTTHPYSTTSFNGFMSKKAQDAFKKVIEKETKVRSFDINMDGSNKVTITVYGSSDGEKMKKGLSNMNRNPDKWQLWIKALSPSTRQKIESNGFKLWFHIAVIESLMIEYN